jgi:hypothetical protein
MTPPNAPETVCSVCGTAGSGRFCANCGATLETIPCAGCGATLSPGASFCHRCGRPAGAAAAAAQPPASLALEPTPRGPTSPLPWALAAIALLALLALSAGKYFSSSRGSALDAPQNALPQAGLDNRSAPSQDQGSGGATPGMRLPDISSMSPQEQADRLFNRVMLLSSQGKTDSVLFFAPMAISVYQMLSPMNSDQRYDLGRIAEISGALPLARAQADTILRDNPNHLLGLILGARVASLTGNAAAQKQFESRFLAAEKSELAKKLPEYDRHQNDITSALAAAQKARGSK